MNQQQGIKNTRMQLDFILNQSKQLSGNREIALAQTNIQRGVMWLGLVLGKLGEQNPYPESIDHTSSKIEERTDQAKDSPATFEGMPTTDRTSSVKWLRLQLQNMVDALMENIAYSNEATQAINALKESKMWFGQELNNIRIESEK